MVQIKTTPTSSNDVGLLISIDDFKQQLEDRIKEGKDLLDFDVPIVSQQNHYQDVEVIYKQEVCDKFISEYNKWNDYNKELLKRSFNYSNNEYIESYKSVSTLWLNRHDVVKCYKNTVELIINNLESLINRLPLIPVIAKINNKPSLDNNFEKQSNEKVFIVHGHDNEIKIEVARFLENLGLDPIILHEQASRGQTIIEKIGEYSDVGFGIILYTPCDVGANKDAADNLRKRARQNVVFEHGYLMGKIGRDKVCALVKGDDLETPGDITGVVYVKKDSEGAWKYKLANEMKAVGYNIDTNNIKI